MTKFTHMLSMSAGAVLACSVAVAGELEVVGTGDGLHLLRQVAEAYSQQPGNTTIVVPDSIGSGGGIAAVSAGENRLARVARVLKESEKAAGLVYVPFARIPSVFFAHETATISSLSSVDIKRIFEGELNTWTDVGGPDRRIRVVRREDGDSTLQVLRASMPGWDNIEFTQRSKMAVTTQDAVETVRTVEGAIGFAPHSEAMGDNTIVLSVDGLKPTDPEYPSAVELAFVYKDGTLDHDMQNFIEFARSDAGRQVLAQHGAMPPH